MRIIKIKNCKECPYRKQHNAINRPNYVVAYCISIWGFPDITNIEEVLPNCPLEIDV
jgi:hypothetical protein